MSAYIVPFAHINYLAKFAEAFIQADHGKLSYYWNGERKNHGDADIIGQILWNENYRSVNYRYKEGSPAPPFQSIPNSRKFDPALIFDAINGLSYQSCECDNWEETEAWAILQALRVRACRMVTDAANVNGWTLDNNEQEQKQQDKLEAILIEEMSQVLFSKKEN